MKIENRTQMVERKYDVFIAEDGTEFFSLGDCAAYEREILEKGVYNRDDIEWITSAENKMPFGLSFMDVESANYEWCIIRSKEAIGLMNEVLQLGINYNKMNTLLCIEHDSNTLEDYAYDFDYMVRNMTETCNALGYRVTIEKEEQ